MVTARYSIISVVEMGVTIVLSAGQTIPYDISDSYAYKNIN